MRKNAWLNNQDVVNWFKTPEEMEFTESGFPILKKCDIAVPRIGIKTTPFNYIKTAKDKDVYIHFFIQDYLFNRTWNSPQKYIDMLKNYKGIVMPDFSWWRDMPKVMQQWQHFRNLWFARICQIQGIPVIPNINYGYESSWEWCFDGLPKDSVVMISAIGCMRTKDKKQIEGFYLGARQMIEILNPSTILLRTTKNLYDEIKSKIGYENYLNYSLVRYKV